MVNKPLVHLIFSCLLVTVISLSSFGQNNSKEQWAESQLTPPSDLANVINSGKAQPILFSIGPGAIIKGSIDIGPAKEKENLKKLKAALSTLPKDTGIVIYCGCCPFQHCPNIRPAFRLLNKMKFTNHKLLSLPKNIKVDWIDKGYPVREISLLLQNL